MMLSDLLFLVMESNSVFTVLIILLAVEVSDTCCNAAYMSQICGQQFCTISQVAVACRHTTPQLLIHSPYYMCCCWV